LAWLRGRCATYVESRLPRDAALQEPRRTRRICHFRGRDDRLTVKALAAVRSAGVALDSGRHSRIVVGASSLSPSLFADFYRAGPEVRARPLVCCWGGAITTDDYEHRRAVPPSPIAEELDAVIESDQSVDLLVLPLPQVEPWDDQELRARILRTFSEELLPLTPNPSPAATAFVGHSAGAYVATVLALGRSDSCALVALGGVGMEWAAAHGSRPVASLSWASFVNQDDPCADEAFALDGLLAANGVTLERHVREGGHDLADYLANGSIRAALRFVAGKVLASAALTSARP
jgi:hypothetical protein